MRKPTWLRSAPVFQFFTANSNGDIVGINDELFADDVLKSPAANNDSVTVEEKKGKKTSMKKGRKY